MSQKEASFKNKVTEPPILLLPSWLSLEKTALGVKAGGLRQDPTRVHRGLAGQGWDEHRLGEEPLFYT